MSKVSDVPVTEEDTGKGGRRRFSTAELKSGQVVKNCMTVILADGELLKSQMYDFGL